jgi:ribose transport system substrate-binding protein
MNQIQKPGIAKSPFARRDLLRFGLLGAGSLVAGPLLVACKGQDGASSATGSSSGPAAAKLGPFDPSRPAGTKPNLPKRIAFAAPSNAEYMQTLGRGIQAAAKDRGLEFVQADANADPQTNVRQMDQFLAQGIGALAIVPLDPSTQSPVMAKAIAAGVAVMAELFAPDTVQLGVDQYTNGNALGLDAAQYIKDNMGGKAQVVIMNQDSIVGVRPRFQGIRDGIKTVPGAEIVADQEPTATTTEGGVTLVSTLLQKYPDANVFLGADEVVLGAYAALQAGGKPVQINGKANPNYYLGGIDGTPQALALITAGNTPYRASFAFATALEGYGFGMLAADWLEGKSIPKVMGLQPAALKSAETIAAFQASQANPAATWNDSAARDKQILLYGNIDYSTKDDYVKAVYAF